MFVKKNLAILFVLAILVTTMTACGSATPSEPAAEASRNEDVSVESPDQSEIEAADESAAPTEEESSMPEDAPDESASSGSGNFQDYWEGEDFFDLVGFMTDNGFEWILPLTKYYDTLNDGDTAGYYECRNEDTHNWWVVVGNTADIQVIYYDDGTKFQYYVSTDYEHQIAVDDTGMTMSESQIIALNSVVQALATNADSTDPLSVTDLDYRLME